VGGAIAETALDVGSETLSPAEVAAFNSDAAARLASASDGDYFSGVFEPENGRIALAKSDASVGREASTRDLVARHGGHGFLNKLLFNKPAENYGFGAQLVNGTIKLFWSSRSVNIENFGVDVASMAHSTEITNIIQGMTNLPVVSG
jgi:hypothetical protein